MAKPTGWWLGLRYMSRDQVITPKEPYPNFPESMMPAQTVFADATVLRAGDKWKEVLQSWRDQCQTLICWIPDVRYHNVPGARVTREDVLEAVKDFGWRCVEDALIEGHAFIVIKRDVGAWHYVPWGQGEAKRCLVFRTGAFGDAIMASTVLPGLKEQGYKISFYSHDRGAEIIRWDPHVDEVVAIGDKQVADDEMNFYWDAISSRFDHVVNLTNAVEGRTLPQAWHNEYWWPDDQRQRAFTGSYLADHHLLAGVPGPYRVKFYPSPEDAEWAEQTANRLGPFVLIALRGSAYYKWYPHMHKVVTQLLAHTSFHIVLAGGPDARDLESVIIDAAIEYHGTKDQYLELFDKSVIDQTNTSKIKNTSQKSNISQDVWDPSSQDGLSKYLPPFKIESNAKYSLYQGKIMNVLVNITYVLNMIENKIQADESNSLLLKPTLEDLIVDLNKALGNFNYFRLGYDQEANVFYITDDQSVPSVNMLDRETGASGGQYDIPLYGKGSIAESFDFKTEFGTKLANLLAISANSDTGGTESQSTAGKEVSSIAKANRGFINRYAPVIGAVNEPAPTPASGAPPKTVNDSTILAALQFNSAIKSFYSDIKSSSQDKVNLCTNYYIERLSKSKVKDPSTNASAMIPLTLNFTMDGISGMYMGNAFTVDEKILPYSFTRVIKSQDNDGNGEVVTKTLGFIVTGLDHSIDGNRWKTSVKANMYYLKALNDYNAEGRNLSNDTGAISAGDFLVAEGGQKIADTDCGCPECYSDPDNRLWTSAPMKKNEDGEWVRSYSCGKQVTSPERVSSNNFGADSADKKYFPNSKFVRKKSNIKLQNKGIPALKDSDIIDYTHKNKFNLGALNPNGAFTPKYFVIHHTGQAQGSKHGADFTIATFYQRGYPVQFIIDRDAKIHRFLPDGAIGWHTYTGTLDGKTIGNGNSLGVEICAHNDSEVTDAQMKAAIQLTHWLGIDADDVYGHGEVQSEKTLPSNKKKFAKLPEEGRKVVTYIRQNLK